MKKSKYITKNNTILESNIINNTTYTNQQITKLHRNQFSFNIIEIKKNLKEMKENTSKIFELINLKLLYRIMKKYFK